MTTTRSLARRIALTVTALAVGVGLIVTMTVPGSLGAFTAKITNPGNAVTNNPAFKCADTTTGLGFPPGPASTVTYPMAETVGTTATDISGNSRSGAYTSSGVTYGASGPCGRDSGRAVTFNGSTGYLSGPGTTLLANATFTQEVWFRTTTGGGKLLGFGSARTGSSTAVLLGSVDRSVYLTNAGNIVFTAASGLGTASIQTPGAYLNGQWHHVLVTQAPLSDANPGMRIYVDGAFVVANATATSGALLSGYWRIGYDSVSGLPSAPTNPFFTGSMAWASLYLGSALTPAQVAAHYYAGVTREPTSGRASFSPATAGTADQYLRHFNYELIVSSITATSPALDRNDATFTMVAGLADSTCVSFVSANFPTYYLRHNDAFRLRIDPSDGTAAFNQDATFCARSGNDGKGTSWWAYDAPTRFWRVYQGALYVASNGGPNAFDTATGWADDTSFNTNAALA